MGSTKLGRLAVDWSVAAIGVAGLVAYVAVHAWSLAGAPIGADGYGHYVYLPAWFLHHDVTLDAVARDCCGGAFPDFTTIVRWPATGQWVNSHPIGEAVLMLPFFLAAHALTHWSNLPPDGFSLYYQHAAGLGGLAYGLGGLALLRWLLRAHFSDAIVLGTLGAVAFGTNLFHYMVFNPTYSHAFSFCLVAALLVLAQGWWTAPTYRTSFALGAVAGLVVLTRHPNAVFLLLFLLYGVTSLAALRDRAARLWAARGRLAVAAATGAAILTPQLWLYHRATGSWLVSPYGDQGFSWGSPHVWGVLFALDRGVFFWSPVLLLAIPGMIVARDWPRGLLVGAGASLGLHAYVIASWWDWTFGGGYGHRGFVDALPLFAIYLAAFFAWVAERPALARAAAAFAVLAATLSLVQMAQYWLGIIPFSDLTWAEYRASFLRFR